MRNKILLYPHVVDIVIIKKKIMKEKNNSFNNNETPATNLFRDSIQKMRDGNPDFFVLSRTKDIKECIIKGETTWEKLGITEEELDALTKELAIDFFKKQINEIRDCKNPHSAEINFKGIKTRIKREVFLWENLGITESDLSELVKKNRILVVKEYVDNILLGEKDLDFLQSNARYIERMIKEEIITWKEIEEMGFSREKLDEIKKDSKNNNKES